MQISEQMFLLSLFNIQSVNGARSRPKGFFRARLAAFLFLLWPLLVFSQTSMIIYDGLTGIHDVSVQNDTAYISTLIPDSPADKAGIRLRDQIIAINDSLVAGTGMNRRAIRQFLKDQSGTRHRT